MGKSSETVFKIDDYTTLPLHFVSGLVTDNIPAFGKGKVQIIYQEPNYEPMPFEYSRECLTKASIDASYSEMALKTWSVHLSNVGYFLQFKDDTNGEKMKRLHSHTQLVSAILTSRLKLSENSLWETFDWLVCFKFVQENYRADKEKEKNYQRHAKALERENKSSDIHLKAGRILERGVQHLEVMRNEWSEIPPIHITEVLHKSQMTKPLLFYSYSHADSSLREELEKHLSILQRTNLIGQWYDRCIGPGEEWKNQIDENLKNAEIVLLLVSADFLASDYCYDIEMEQALQQHKEGKSKVIPIFLRPCDWDGSPFGKLQGLPTDAIPVTKWENQDEAFTCIAKGIRSAVIQLKG